MMFRCILMFLNSDTVKYQFGHVKTYLVCVTGACATAPHPMRAIATVFFDFERVAIV